MRITTELLYSPLCERVCVRCVIIGDRDRIITQSLRRMIDITLAHTMAAAVTHPQAKSYRLARARRAK